LTLVVHIKSSLQTQFGEDRCTQFRHYRGNRPTNARTNKQTHRQDRLQYTVPLSLARSVIMRRLHFDIRLIRTPLGGVACSSGQLGGIVRLRSHASAHPSAPLANCCLSLSYKLSLLFGGSGGGGGDGAQGIRVIRNRRPPRIRWRHMLLSCRSFLLL